MINFDRVAGIYDATRGLPEGIDEAIADRIVAATNAGHGTRFLEVGVGTGRIAAPLVRRGFPFTGVDISEQMLDRLRQKVGQVPTLTVIQGDITSLSLPDDSQDVVVAVHIFHLVPEWRKALDEALRVLAPGGFFIYAGNTTPDYTGRGEFGRIRGEWGRLVREMGGDIRPRYGEWADTQEAITDRGGRIAVYRGASWMREFRPIELMEAMRRQSFSAAWSVPQDVLDAVHDRLVAWGRETYGDVEARVTEEEEFLLHVCRFER